MFTIDKQLAGVRSVMFKVTKTTSIREDRPHVNFNNSFLSNYMRDAIVSVGISCRRVSVCPSVSLTPVLCQNG